MFVSLLPYLPAVARNCPLTSMHLDDIMGFMEGMEGQKGQLTLLTSNCIVAKAPRCAQYVMPRPAQA